MIQTIMHVLIETYWNVKISIALLRSCVNCVLIETYWNVKIISDNIAVSIFGINRNILECKVDPFVIL